MAALNGLKLFNDAVGHAAGDEALRALAVPLVRRAGLLAAGMAYFALYHQLRRKSEALLSLDSTQALHLPGYFKAMEERLAALAGGARIALQRPTGEITVPMKGLAEALCEEAALLDKKG